MNKIRPDTIEKLDELLLKKDYDNLAILIEHEFDNGILSEESVNLARSMKLPTTVIYLTSLCIENIEHNAYFVKWLAVYQAITRKSLSESFLGLADTNPIKITALYLAQANAEETAQFTNCGNEISQWHDAIELAIDFGQFSILKSLIQELAQRKIDTRHWLQLAKLLIGREERLPLATDVSDYARSYEIIRQRLHGTAAVSAVRSTLALHAMRRFFQSNNYEAAIRSAQQANAPADQLEVAHTIARSYCHLGQLSTTIEWQDKILARLCAQPRHSATHDATAKSAQDAHDDFDTAGAGQALADLQHILDGIGKRAFLVSGTLLGYAREGQLMAHDKDVDVGIIGWEEQFDIIDAIHKSGLFWIDFKRLKGQQSYCIPIFHLQHGITIDIFLYQPKNGKLVTGVNHDYGYLQTFAFTPFELQEIEFLDTKFFAPSDIEKNLEENFGDWRTPDPNYISHLESPSTMDPGGTVYQIVVRNRLMESIIKQKPDQIDRVIALVEKFKDKPFNLKPSTLNNLKKVSRQLRTDSGKK